jgi:hypothetical protein
MLYWLAPAALGSTKISGSADALADSACTLSPVEACTSSVNVSPRSPDRARVLKVPENDLFVVPQDPSLQTTTKESPDAPVWTLSSANPMP